MGNKLDNLLVKPCHPHGQNQSRRFSDSRHQYQQPAYNQPSQPQKSSHLRHQQQQKLTQHQYYDHQGLSYVPEKPEKPKRNSSFSFSRRKGKLNSCPDLLKGAEPYYYGGNASGLSYGLKEYKSDSSEKTVDIKIYRSYTDLPSDTQQPLKIKVYRKSQESLVNVGRVQSLPKGINRTDSSEFSNSIESRLSVAATAQELTRPPSRRSSSRCSNVSSSVTNCRTSINVDDFPNVDTVKKKLSVFEQFFANLVLKYFKNLTLLDQLSCICVAVMPDRANQSVSLLHYFQSNDIPDDLGRSEIALQRRENETDPPNILPLYPTLPDFLLDEIREVKFITLPDEQAAVCQDLASKIIAFLAKEAAIELGRIYEYQLSLIQETIAFRLLAKYAATNVFEAVKNRGKLLDKNTIISSAIMQLNKRGSTISGSTAASDYGSSAASPKWVSVICFSKELKWNIYDIFRKSALRKEVFVPDSPSNYGGGGNKFANSPSFSPPNLKRPGSSGLLPQTPVSFIASDRKSYEPENSPWKFYASSDSDPMLYGYRSQAVEWDFVRRRYRLSSSDESRFVEELPWRYDDVHRLYCPYFRIFCDLHLSTYCDWVKSFGDARAGQNIFEESAASSRSGGSELLRPTARGFKEYTRQFRSGIHVREDCKLVYRNVAGYEQQSSRRNDVLALKNAILSGDAESLGSSQCATEVTSTPEFTHHRVPGFSDRPSSASCAITAENGGQGDVESLRRAIAQVTMDCDQLCFNLKDMESE